MRYSREHKLETHDRIVKRASVRLREKGAHGIGVADLMKDAGLTHGGFYAHFDSREALVIEAFAYAMDRSTERWRKLGEQTPPEKRLAAIVDSYLTTAHRDDPGHGCAVPTLGAEIARESPKTRKAFAAKLEQMVDMIAEQIPALPRKAARKQADGDAGDHDGYPGAGPHRRQWRVFRRDFGRRPRGRAGARDAAEAGGEEIRRQKGRRAGPDLTDRRASSHATLVVGERKGEPSPHFRKSAAHRDPFQTPQRLQDAAKTCTRRSWRNACAQSDILSAAVRSRALPGASRTSSSR